jgi:hypothetical protein
VNQNGSQQTWSQGHTMPPTETYQQAIVRLYGRRPAGEAAEEIQRGEERLGMPFPKALRDHYRFAGHKDPVNRTQDRLRAPTALFRSAGAVVFYEENQGVNLWGILDGDFGMDDPPVYAAWNEEPLKWEPDHARLSEFLRTMAYWQAANGALPNIALGHGDEQVPALAARHWPELGNPGDRWGIRIFSRDGQVVCVLGEPGSACQVHAAGRTPADVRRIQELLPLEWSLVETEDD